MKVKELQEFIDEVIKDGRLDLNSDVIVVGEYDYGESLGKPYITNMSLIDEDSVIKENVQVLAMGIDAYLYESEDLGYSRMWINNQDLGQMREEGMLDEED
jgi:hypothetical protein